MMMKMLSTQYLRGVRHIKRGRKMKIVAIILACVLLDIVLHIVTSSYSTVPENASFSLVASVLGTEVTASFWALFAFSGVAFVYVCIRNEIPGEDVKKGLRYGTAIALLWIFAMPWAELLPYWQQPTALI